MGSRYVPGGKVVGWPRLRKLISHSANWAAHVFSASPPTTARLVSAATGGALETIDLDGIFSTGYSFLIEMAFLCQQAGFRIAEAPITFVNRTQGASKISKVEHLQGLLHAAAPAHERPALGAHRSACGGGVERKLPAGK